MAAPTTPHRVQQGECLESIAEHAGLLPDTVWNHPDNAGLRERRGDAHTLLPGDVLHVPERTEKEVACATEATHRFVRKGVPVKLRVRLLVAGEPRRNEELRVDLDGAFLDARTDGDGWLEIPIQPDSHRARVYFRDDPEPVELWLGHLDPIDTESGVGGRLRNLGYFRGRPGDRDEAALEEALVEFQAAEGLEITGEADEATRATLARVYGG